MKRVFYSRYGLIAPSQRYKAVKCNVCGTEWLKLKTTFKKWQGNCRSCAQKLAKSDPQLKYMMAEIARKQILAQNGIPNAKKFTKGSTAKEKNCKWISDRNQVKTKRQMQECQEWRKLVFERDNYTCVACGARGGRLHAHHIKSFVLFHELRHEISNGETLCFDCHKKTGSFGGKLNDGTNLYEAGRTAAMAA